MNGPSASNPMAIQLIGPCWAAGYQLGAVLTFLTGFLVSDAWDVFKDRQK